MFAVGLVVPAQSIAQDLLTLESAIRTGLKNNYTIQITQNQQQIAENNNSLGNAGFLPRVSASAQGSKSVTSSQQEYFTGTTNNRDNAGASSLNADVALNWTIFDGFQMFASKSRLQQLESQGKLNTRITIESTVSDIVNAYYNIVRQQQTLAVLKDAMNISRERVDIAQAKLNVGSGSGLELLQAKADHNADKSAVIRQQAVVSNAKTDLNKILARDLETAFTVTDTIPLIPDLQKDSLMADIEAQNSQLEKMKTDQEVARLNLHLIESKRYPEVGVNLGYNFAQSSSESGFLKSNKSQGYSFGVSASVGLFDGLNIDRQAENAKIQIRNSRFQYQDLLDQIRSNFNKTWQDYENGLQLVSLELVNVQVAQQTVNVAREKYRLGSITPLELKEAQKSYIQSESRLVDARYQAKQAETELLRLSGRLLQHFPQ